MTAWLMSLVLVLWTGIGVAGPQAAKQALSDPIRVFVFTDIPPTEAKRAEAEKVDLKERIEATKDITSWYKKNQEKTIAVVDRREAADVIVEVAAVQLAPGMTLAERTAGYLHRPRYDVWSVRAKVTAGTFTNEMAHQGQFPALVAEGVGRRHRELDAGQPRPADRESHEALGCRYQITLWSAGGRFVVHS